MSEIKIRESGHKRNWKMIMAENTEIDNNNEPEQEKPSMAEMLNSNTRLLIFAMLSIYSELSLTQLSKKVHKSKSTVHEQIQKMIAANMVEVSREEDCRSNLKQKFYSLTEESRNEADVKCDENYEEATPEYCHAAIDNFKSFTELQLVMNKNFLKFFNMLEKKIDSGKTEEVTGIINKFKKEWIKLSTIEFYTEEEVREFRELCLQAYYKVYENRIAKGTSMKTEKPYYGSISIYPLKSILNFINTPKKKAD